MASVEEQIAARVVALAATVPAVAGRVYRDREDALAREESPAVLVELVDGDTEPMAGFRPGMPGQAGRVDLSRIRLSVTVCVRGAGYQSVGDAVRVAVHALVMTDATLLALCADVRRDRVEFRAANTDQPFGTVAQGYEFRTLTRAGALDSLAS